MRNLSFQNIFNLINNKRKLLAVSKSNYLLIYDVTCFINKHPGGKQAIMNKILKYDDFKNLFFDNCLTDYNFHSKNGKKIWEQYLIGKIIISESFFDQ